MVKRCIAISCRLVASFVVIFPHGTKSHFAPKEKKKDKEGNMPLIISKVMI